MNTPLITTKINSQNVKNIKVKNPGILKVPEGSNVWRLTKKHIVSLVKKEGKAKISRAVQNLLRWNKNKRTESANKIRAWANKAAGWVSAEESTASIICANVVNSVKVNVIAGPAGEALIQIVTALQIFTALLEGEEAPLREAPDSIKSNTKKLIEDTKKLVSEVNAMINPSSGSEVKEEEGKEKKEVEKVKIKK